MRGAGRCLITIAVLACAAASAAPVALKLSPAEPVKGRDTEATLEITLDADRPAPPVLRANVGTIERVERVGAGRFRARYVLPASRAPEVAIIVAFAPWPSPQSVEGAFGVLRVPMASSVEVPGRAEPGAEVRLTLAEQTFGPVRAQADGSFRLPVVVPPGYGIATTTTVDRVGNKRTAKLNLMLPRVDQLACVATPTELPADGASKARVLCASSDQYGAPTRRAKIVWKGGRGTWSQARELGDGVQEWTWTAPRELGEGREVLRAAWKQGAVDSSEELSLALSQGPVRSLAIRGEDRVVQQGASWALTARASDGLGRPLAGVVVSAPGLPSGVTDARGEATLRWAVTAAEPLGARTLLVSAAGPMGRDPAKLIAWRSGDATRVQVVDLSGLPVPSQRLTVGADALMTGDDGTALVPAGVSEVSHAEWPGLRLSLASVGAAPGVTEALEVRVVEPPPINVRVRRGPEAFEWWLETTDGKVVEGRAVEIRGDAGPRRVVSAGRQRESYGAGLVVVTDVQSRVSAVVERAP